MILSKDQIRKALENAKPLTPEQKKKLEELGEKMKKLSPQEMREIRKRLDEQDGYC